MQYVFPSAIGSSLSRGTVAWVFSPRRHLLDCFFCSFVFQLRSIFSALKNVDLRNWIVKIQKKKSWRLDSKTTKWWIKHSTKFLGWNHLREFDLSDETTNGIFEGQKNLMWDLPWNMWIVLWHGQRIKQKCTATCFKLCWKKRFVVIETSWRCPVVTDRRVEPCEQGSWWYWI